jgi:molybdenum cofactor cytidylyltransferase
MSGPGLIVLAAGASKRMGRPKQLLPWKGRTLLRHACETALATSLRPIVVVLGCEANACEQELAGLDVRHVTNSEWSKGMGSSVASGIASLEGVDPGTSGALLMLVDQPDLTASFLESMVELWLKSDQGIVATQYPEGGGVPALFSRSFFSALQALDGDLGARQIIARAESAVTLVQSPDELTDLDTPKLFERRAVLSGDPKDAEQGD